MSSTQPFWSKSKWRGPKLRGPWGGLSTAWVARATGLPHRKAYQILVRYRERLERDVEPEDLALLLWEIVDSRIKDEVEINKGVSDERSCGISDSDTHDVL